MPSLLYMDIYIYTSLVRSTVKFVLHIHRIQKATKLVKVSHMLHHIHLLLRTRTPCHVSYMVSIWICLFVIVCCSLSSHIHASFRIHCLYNIYIYYYIWYWMMRYICCFLCALSSLFRAFKHLYICLKIKRDIYWLYAYLLHYYYYMFVLFIVPNISIM